MNQPATQITSEMVLEHYKVARHQEDECELCKSTFHLAARWLGFGSQDLLSAVRNYHRTIEYMHSNVNSKEWAKSIDWGALQKQAESAIDKCTKGKALPNEYFGSYNLATPRTAKTVDGLVAKHAEEHNAKGTPVGHQYAELADHAREIESTLQECVTTLRVIERHCQNTAGLKGQNHADEGKNIREQMLIIIAKATQLLGLAG